MCSSATERTQPVCFTMSYVVPASSSRSRMANWLGCSDGFAVDGAAAPAYALWPSRSVIAAPPSPDDSTCAAAARIAIAVAALADGGAYRTGRCDDIVEKMRCASSEVNWMAALLPFQQS